MHCDEKARVLSTKAKHVKRRTFSNNRGYSSSIFPWGHVLMKTEKNSCETVVQCSKCMVSEMVQNSQSLYSFTFTAVIVIHEYIYSHSTTKFTFKKYICLHLTTYFLFRNIFTHIYGMYRSHSTAHIRSHSRSKYSFNTVQYSFNIFCALPLRIVRSQLPAAPGEPSLINFV